MGGNILGKRIFNLVFWYVIPMIFEMLYSRNLLFAQ